MCAAATDNAHIPTHPTPDYLGPLTDRTELFLAAGLSALAGLVGAAAFLYSTGSVVTFMTGNSERVVLEHTQGQSRLALAALGLILTFVAGVVVATLLRQMLWRKAKHGATMVMSGATVVAAVSDRVMYQNGEYGFVPVMSLAFGLGALNTCFTVRGETSIPLSYVTGTLVKIGQGVASHVTGYRRWAWVPHAAAYTGFLTGAGIGGLAFTFLNPGNVLDVIVIASLVCTISTWRYDHHRFNEHHTGPITIRAGEQQP